MQSTAAKLSALIAVTDWGYGAGYARAWPYRYGTYGVWSGAPRTYTDVSNYTEGTRANGRDAEIRCNRKVRARNCRGQSSKRKFLVTS